MNTANDDIAWLLDQFNSDPTTCALVRNIEELTTGALAGRVLRVCTHTENAGGENIDVYVYRDLLRDRDCYRVTDLGTTAVWLSHLDITISDLANRDCQFQNILWETQFRNDELVQREEYRGRNPLPVAIANMAYVIQQVTLLGSRRFQYLQPAPASTVDMLVMEANTHDVRSRLDILFSEVSALRELQKRVTKLLDAVDRQRRDGNELKVSPVVALALNNLKTYCGSL